MCLNLKLRTFKTLHKTFNAMERKFFFFFVKERKIILNKFLQPAFDEVPER